jgi:hypothetical protein
VTGQEHFLYNSARENLGMTALVDTAFPTGAFGSVVVSQPRVEPGWYRSGGHSLAELTVESEDGKQIVEVGWIVGNTGSGDPGPAPRLFVFHWINGKQTCYNGCGWKQTSTTKVPGMVLTPAARGELTSMGISYFGGNWWVFFDNEYIGYFPESLWASASPAFDHVHNAQWFGEVCSGTSDTPPTGMGNGVFGTAQGACRWADLYYMHSSTNSSTWAAPSYVATNPQLYVIGAKGVDRGFAFGGPGSESE